MYIAGTLLLCAAFAAVPLSGISRMFLMWRVKPKRQAALPSIEDAPLVAAPLPDNDDEPTATDLRTSKQS
jgi:hypothetical protein